MQPSDDDIIKAALHILARRAGNIGVNLSKYEDTKAFLMLEYAGLEHEVFSVMFLDVRNRLIHFEKMFAGTIDVVEVPIREVVKAALKYNAKSVVICHNHPSGEVWASPSDIKLTNAVREALDLMEIGLMDHIIVSPSKVLSFHEEGLL